MASPLSDPLTAPQAVFNRVESSWYIFGAQAAIVHGASRLTADVDITVLLDIERLTEFVSELEREGFAVRTPNIHSFANETRVVPVVHLTSGIPVDVVLGGPGLEEMFAERAQGKDVAGIVVPVATAEDIVAMKILAGREKDLSDAAVILQAQESSIDHGLIQSTLALLESALDRSDLAVALQRLRDRGR